MWTILLAVGVVVFWISLSVYDAGESERYRKRYRKRTGQDTPRESMREFHRAMFPEPPYEGSEKLGDYLYGPDGEPLPPPPSDTDEL